MTISPDPKINLSITNDAKTFANPTWNDMTGTWENQTGTWDNPKQPLTHDSKNNLSIGNDTKN